MSRAKQLRASEPLEVVRMLEGDGLRDNNDPAELKLALLNALERVAALEAKAHNHSQVPPRPLKD